LIAEQITLVNQQPSSTLAIAIAALVLSLGSIAAQAVLYWLNGSRITLALRWSMTGPGTLVTLDLDKTDHFTNLKAQGLVGPYLAVEVTNKGRGETNIVGVKAVLDNGLAILPTSVSVPFNPLFRIFCGHIPRSPCTSHTT
jgi:hypothetical protein